MSSPPVAEIVGLPPVAALATVISFTALPVAVALISSLPLASAMNPPESNLKICEPKEPISESIGKKAEVFGPKSPVASTKKAK